MNFAGPRAIPGWAIGPLVTLALIAGIELLTRTGILKIPNPVVLVLIGVIYAGYSSGLRPAFVSAALALAYGLYFWAAPGAFLQYSGEDVVRLAVLGLVTPFLAWMTGALRDRAERALRRQLKAERVQVDESARAERRAKAHETQLRSLIDALPAYVAYVDRDLRVRLHNKAYEDWTGLPASSIDGRKIEEVIGKELFESGTREHALAALDGRTAVFERVHLDARGRRSVVEAHFVPDVTEDGSVAGYFGMLFDVSSHKASQARVGRLAERLRRALDGSRLVLWELDLRTGDVELGREWADIVGGKRVMSTVAAGELRRRVHRDDRARLDEALRSVIERRAEAYDVEHRVRAMDGEWKWIRSTGKAVEFDAAGKPLRLSGTNRDVTLRKRAELAVQENERRLRLVTDAVPALIVYADADLRYRFCNRGYRETMGLSEAEILGRTVREVVGDAQFEISRPWLERTLAGETVEHERRHRWADGRVADMSVTYVPHVGENGTVQGFYALLVDLTERKRAERIKERFISMVSHELRTPLTSIIWTLNVLSENQASAMSKEELETVALAQQNAERMLRLADEILEIEQIDQSELRMSASVVDVPALVERALALNNGVAQKYGAELVAPRLAPASVRADPDRLLQVLSNLLSNAAKHSPRGGRVEVAIEMRGAMVRVSVSDSGPGVPEKFRDRLFGRFEQSADGRAKGGSGLGLAICKEIIERSGGAIGYDPNPEGGSVFWFELPALAPAQGG